MDNHNTPESGNIIILHPDFKKLKADVDKLRTKLSMLVFERDDLLYQESRNIEMAYMLAVGALEYKAYEIESEVLRVRRKAELIQAKKNRQEKIVLSKIENVLDIEFAKYQEKLNAKIDKMNAALERSRGQMLTEEESQELKKLYRSVVKALHPDLHPVLSNAKIQLFYNAVTSYENGDLNGLRTINAMVSEPAVTADKPDGLAVLMKEKERLTKLLKSIKDRIAEIKSTYPYTMKSFLQNPDEIEERKAGLKEYIKQLNEALSAYTERIDEMLR